MRIRWPVILLSALLSTAAVIANEPHGPASEPDGAEAWRQKVIRLILELDALDADTRQRATAELIELGPSVLGPLRQMLEESPTPQLRARARVIRSHWRHVSDDGGDVVGDFQAMLRAGEGRGAAGGPIGLVLEMRNVSRRPRRFVEIRGLDVELPGGAEWISPDSDGRIIIRPIEQAVAAGRGSTIVYPDVEMNSITFSPGGIISTFIRLDSTVELGPGAYDVQVIYYARTKNLLQEAHDDLRSNMAQLIVVEQFGGE